MEGVRRSSPRTGAPPPVERLGRTTPLRIALLTVVTGELLALSLLPYERAEARYMILRQYNHARIAWLMRRDPALGRPVTMSDLGLRASPGPAGIITISDCQGCSLRAVREFAARLSALHIAHLYALSPRKPKPEGRELMRNQCRRIGVRAELIWDRRGAARQRLNAFFAPRAYIVNSTGRLRWLQRPGEPLEPESAG